MILTDRLANIQRIRSLLAAIDTEAVAERQMKAYTLLHASGAVVADLINRTFGGVLNNAGERLDYYRRVIRTALAEPATAFDWRCEFLPLSRSCR